MVRRSGLWLICAALVALWLVGIPSLVGALPGTPNEQHAAAQITATGVTLTATPTLADIKVRVVTPVLNVRAGPGVNFPIVGTIPKDTIIQLIGANADATWYVIEFEGQPRWISAFVQSVETIGDPKLLPTFTPPPTPTRTPTNTRTATPQGVWGVVIGTFLNVRSGPGANYPILGRLQRGESVIMTGANANITWFTITFRGQQAWILNDRNLLRVSGDRRTLPVIQPPPTPTLAPTATPTFTPTPLPSVDLVMLSATLSPPIPQPGVPFTLSVLIQNQGNLDAGAFAVATAFDPGQVFAAQNVPGLPAGQQATVNLGATVAGTGLYTIAIVLDLNNQVTNELPDKKANNKPTFSYKVDRGFVAQGQVQLAPSTNFDLFGGTQDLSYTGPQLAPINGAKANILVGQQLNNIHYDLLSPSIITNTTPLNQVDLAPGVIVGIITAEGQRAFIRVASYNGANIVFDYYVYVP